MRSFKGYFSHAWFPWLGLALSLSTSLVTWHFVRRAERKRIQEYFQSECTLVEEKLSQKMLALEQILKGASQFIAHGPQIPTRPEWRLYVQNLDLNRLNPGVQGLGFSQWIPLDRLDAHIQAMRAGGYPDYQVLPGGPLPPEGGVSSIVYLEPMDERNMRAFSKDMHAESIRREAMNRARDFGLVSLTGRVTLYQEGSSKVQAGTLLYAPIYAKGASLDTIQHRRSAFLGWAYMPFRMENLVQAALGSHLSALSIQLYDGDTSQESRLLFKTPGAHPIPHPVNSSAHISDFHVVRHFDVSGRTWTLCCAPGQGFAIPLGGGGHFVVLFLGIFTSIGIFIFLSHTVRAEKKALGIAQEQLEKFKLILDSTAEAIYGIDLNGNCTFCNPSCLHMLGYSDQSELLGKNMHWQIHYSKEDGQVFPLETCHIFKAFQEGKEAHADNEVFWRKDRQSFKVEYWSFPQRSQGRIVGAVVTFLDITERTRITQQLKESETNFRTFFETIDDIIIVADTDGRLRYTNPALTRHLGYSTQELESMTVLELHPAELRGQAQQIFEAMTKGEADRCPLPLLTRDGGHFPVETRVWAGKWNDTPCVFANCKDNRAQEEILKQQSMITSLLDSIPDIIFFKNQTGVYMGCNPPFCALVGRRPEAIINHTDYDIFDREIADFFRANDRLTLENLAPRHNEEWVSYPNGHRVLLDTLKTPYYNSKGELIGILGISRDITERKTAEEALAESEQRLAHALAATGDGVWDWMVQTGNVKHNARWCEILGLGAEFLEHSIEFFSSHIFEDDRSRVMAKVQSCLEDGKPYFSRHRMKKADDSIVWVADRGQVVERDESGKALRMIGSIADISDLVASENAQKETEQELRFQSRLQQMLMEISNTYINLPLEGLDDTIEASLGELAQFVGADRAYIFSYDWQEGTSSNTHEWCAEGTTPEIENLQDVPNEGIPEWITTHQKGEVMHIPDVLALPPGHLRDILEPQNIKSLLTVPLMDEADCVGFVGFDVVQKHHPFSQNEQSLLTVFAQMLVNVWRRQRSEAALREANMSLASLAEKAKAASKAKSEFLANMSHEIRTPMNGILGMLDLLLGTSLNEKQHHYARSAHGSGKSLLGLINDILDLSKVESGKIQIEQTPFHLQSLLQDVHLTLSPSAEKKQLDFHFKIDPGAPTHLMSDPARLRQVLINLAGNAIKFTHQGSVEIRVETKEESPESALIHFAVQDSGIGIRLDKQEDIFNEFTQADTSTTRKYGGTGLGLAISRRLVELLGGKLSLKSREGEGSTFFFTLKLSKATGDLPQKADHPQDRSPLHHDFKGVAILLVEDNLVNQDVAVAILEQWGLKVDIANNGLEALEALQKKHYQLVLMDVQMPEMDGIEATRTLRKPESGVINPEILVIAMTAHAMAEDRQKCLDAGMNDFLIKPVHPANLMAALERHLPKEAPSQPAPPPQPPPQEAADSKTVFDPKAFTERLMGNQKAAVMVIETFKEDVPVRLEIIEKALESGDMKTLHREFHNIKGASATLAGEALRELALELEKAAKDEGIQKIKDGLPELKQAVQRLVETLDAWVKGATRQP